MLHRERKKKKKKLLDGQRLRAARRTDEFCMDKVVRVCRFRPRSLDAAPPCSESDFGFPVLIRVQRAALEARQLRLPCRLLSVQRHNVYDATVVLAVRREFEVLVRWRSFCGKNTLAEALEQCEGVSAVTFLALPRVATFVQPCRSETRARNFQTLRTYFRVSFCKCKIVG